MDRWNQKVAVVTGASSGIGKGVVKRLVAEGLQVVGLARRVELVESVALELQSQPGKLHPYKVDVTNEEDLVMAFKWVETNLGPVQILVNNAGITCKTSLKDGETNDWRRILDTNLLSPCVASRETLRSVARHKVCAHILNINSVYGKKIGDKTHMYGVSKHGMVCASKLLRQEIKCADLKVKVTDLHPGYVDTNILGKPIKESIAKMGVSDIVDVIMFVLSTPPEIEIQELMVEHIDSQL